MTTPDRSGPRTEHRTGTIELGGERVGYQLLRVRRRRHVHLAVTDDATVEVRGPLRISHREARALIQEHRMWLLRKLVSARARKRSRPGLSTGSRLPLLDELLRLELVSERQLDLFGTSLLPDAGVIPGRVEGPDGWVVRRGQRLEVHHFSPRPNGSAHSATEAPADSVKRLLVSWFRREAAQRLPARIRAIAPRLGLYPARVTVRAQQTLWGSCTEKGNISLNWRLVLLPSALADYVLVHELCHLRHLDHSRRFWALVATLIPDYAKRQRALASWQGRLAL